MQQRGMRMRRVRLYLDCTAKHQSTFVHHFKTALIWSERTGSLQSAPLSRRPRPNTVTLWINFLSTTSGDIVRPQQHPHDSYMQTHLIRWNYYIKIQEILGLKCLPFFLVRVSSHICQAWPPLPPKGKARIAISDAGTQVVSEHNGVCCSFQV